MTYDDLKKMVSMKSDGRSLAAIDDVLKSTVDVITNRIATGDKVKIPGLGTFSRKKHAARKVRNPLNGKLIDVPAKMFPKFSPSQTLKDAVK